MFPDLRKALDSEDADEARDVIRRCRAISATCKQEIDRTVQPPGDEGGAGGARPSLAYVLLLRHEKRIASHLKNTAKVQVEPVHKLS